MSRRVLLLDVMDTLVHDPFRESVPEVFGRSVDAYFEVKRKDVYLAFEEGRISEATYAATMLETGPVDLAPLKAAFRRGYRWIDGIPELLDELGAAGVPCHALSNYGVFYRIIEEELSVSRRVPWTFVSCRTGLRKPAADAFLHASRRLGVAPADLVFVDDREKNCVGARAAGLTALRFVDTPTLRRDLVDLGILDQA